MYSSIRFVAVCVLLLSVCAVLSKSTGLFQLQVLSIHNYRGELMDGSCCGGYRSAGGGCPLQCNTAFVLCLKEYQSHITTGMCTYGNLSTAVVTGNSFSVQNEPNKEILLSLPFSFSWTRSFTFILDAVDVTNSDSIAPIIEQKPYSGIILPSTEWHNVLYTGTAAKLTFRIRVICDKNYYNSTCTVFCRPRNDKFGHYTCNEEGEKVCLPGWKGPTCEEAICREGCHPVHGYCDRPGQCNCRHGWKSELCDHCIPYPGCKHGYCDGSPWQCICDVNWGGILCDQDLNYCGRHRPCQNLGTCQNVAPDQYKCICPQGFSGRNCEIVDNPCIMSPCLNGGTCSEISSTFICSCAPGWTGTRCENNINECESSPCLNGGTCADLVDGYHCLCTTGWEGSICESDANECDWDPCANAIACHNKDGSYECECQDGWEGKNCTKNIDDCIGHCQNGATCVDLINDYHCACLPGFTGRDCQTNINECASSPCANGGECMDLIASFRCICPIGYRGSQCEFDVDLCNPNPCENGASCFNMHRDYYCHCSSDYYGKNCSHERAICTPPFCDGKDNCVAYITTNDSAVEIVKTTACGIHGKCISEPYADFSCVCDSGYTGRYCHENVNDCASYPCRNGGTCIDGLNSYYCVCKEGWEGSLCQIEKDECESNPCLNNGTCIDAEAGFWCECKHGWKGKLCNLKNTHCDVTTCQNGGTCHDLGDSFQCVCPEDWVGYACHLSVNPSCKSNPCQNGATCIDNERSYSCVCREGFDGHQCQHNIDDCLSNPCFNGAHCIDGDNWFLCECSPGFSGPDCRININECASSPCPEGSTCEDGINEYRCICPPGKTGLFCEIDDIKVCDFQGIKHSEGSRWEFECNSCLCQNGEVICSRVPCEIPTCNFKKSFYNHSKECSQGNVCVPVFNQPCLSLPCTASEQCVSEKGLNLYLSERLPSHCKPNDAILGNNCVKLSVMVERIKPIVHSLNQVCFELQRFVWALDFVSMPVYVQCGFQEHAFHIIEITISSEMPPTQEIHTVLIEIIQKMAEYMKKRKRNTPFLDAVSNVKIEKQLSETTKNGEQKYLIPFVASLLVVILGIIIAILFYIRKRRCFPKVTLVQETSRCNDIKGENEALTEPNNLKRDNCGEYSNSIHSTSHHNLTNACDNMTQSQLNFSKTPDQIHKTYDHTVEKNNTCSLPFKKNFDKNEINFLQKKDILEQDLVV
ncbi:protein jagged-1-like [Uloborus diversus]|uniref:protein jagged-1-like n=1 Tax=Uloborus diversus TaxID=327109 RepID=UPI00240A2B62|nr:protein jagged-1-like [Uloborus diversus]